MKTYDKGDVVRVSAAFTTEAGVAVDPTVVKFAYRAPGDNTTTTFVCGVGTELVQDGDGCYHVDLHAETAGVWKYRWYSTDVGKAAASGSFLVEESIV